MKKLFGWMFRLVNSALASTVGELASKAAVQVVRRMVATGQWRMDDVERSEALAAEIGKAIGDTLFAFGAAITIYIRVRKVYIGC